LKFIPPSNDPSGATLANGEALYFSGASRQNNQDSFDVKIDHRFSDKDQFSGRYSFGNSHTILLGAFSDQPEFAPAVGGGLGQGVAVLPPHRAGEHLSGAG